MFPDSFSGYVSSSLTSILMNEIIINPEVLLSAVILGLVLCGENQSVLKISVGILIIVGFLICFNGAESLDIVFWSCYNSKGLLIWNSWIALSKMIIIMGSISILWMGAGEIIMFGSTPFLILMVTLSSLLLVSSANWLLIYLSIELQTLTLFVLVALKRDSALGTEAGLKYFVLGAMSSGLFLFGCSLLFGLTGESSIQGINSILTGGVGKILITISLLFKLSVAPFHMWAPDVYEGAPTIITALLATVPKIGIFSILVQISPVINVILVCAVLSIVYGAIGGLNQTKLKRLLAYSGITHMGFLLFGLAIGTFEGIQASFVYMVVYIVMSICSFSVILALNLVKDQIIELSGLSRNNPVIALTFALTFLSIAGIPPLAGFLSKWLILLAGITSGYYLTCFLVVVSAVIGGAYYVRIVQIVYFQVDYSILIWQNILKKEKNVKFKNSLLIGATFFILLFLIFNPHFLFQITHDAAVSLY